MLTELARGERKSVQHVLVHLLPYLGGGTTLKALRTDSPDDPECRVCYSDAATADGLTALRDSLSAAQLQVQFEGFFFFVYWQNKASARTTCA